MNDFVSTFPEKRADSMRDAARSFDWRNPPTQLKVRTDHIVADASESAFLSRQLEYMRPGVLEVEYPELKGSRLVPVDTNIDPGAEWYTYVGSDYAGSAEIGGGYGNSAPRSDVKAKDGAVKIHPVKGAYAYTFQENRNAMLQRIALPARKAMACRDIIERALDNLILLGNTGLSIQGLLKLSGTTTYTIPTGSGGSKLWTLKSTDEVLADMNGVGNKIVTDTNEVEQPDTLLLPLSMHALVSFRRVGDGTSATVLEFYKQSAQYAKNVENTFKADTASGTSGLRVTAYRRDPNKLVAAMLPFEQLAPQAEAYEIVTYCHARSAGVIAFKPKSIAYGDIS